MTRAVFDALGSLTSPLADDEVLACMSCGTIVEHSDLERATHHTVCARAGLTCLECASPNGFERCSARCQTPVESYRAVPDLLPHLHTHRDVVSEECISKGVISKGVISKGVEEDPYPCSCICGDDRGRDRRG
jgi:hypothetical protein